jgi:hypothetical protein
MSASTSTVPSTTHKAWESLLHVPTRALCKRYQRASADDKASTAKVLHPKALPQVAPYC